MNVRAIDHLWFQYGIEGKPYRLRTLCRRLDIGVGEGGAAEQEFRWAPCMGDMKWPAMDGKICRKCDESLDEQRRLFGDLIPMTRDELHIAEVLLRRYRYSDIEGQVRIRSTDDTTTVSMVHGEKPFFESRVSVPKEPA